MKFTLIYALFATAVLANNYQPHYGRCPAKTSTITKIRTKTCTSTKYGWKTKTRTITVPNGTKTVTCTKTVSGTCSKPAAITQTVTEIPGYVTHTGTETLEITETISHTATDTLEFTETVSHTVSLTETQTLSFTETATETLSLTETATHSVTETATETQSFTETATLSLTETASVTETATLTESLTETLTATTTSVSVSVSSFCACPTGDASGNLINNGGFETNIGDAWNVYTAGSVSQGVASGAGDSHSGQRGYRMTINHNNFNLPQRIIQAIRVCPGKTYRGGFWYKRITTGDGNITIRMILGENESGNGFIVGGPITSGNSPGAWTQANLNGQGTWTATSEVALVTIEFTYSQAPSNLKSVIIDDITLTEVI